MDLLKMKCYRNRRLDAMVIQCELCSVNSRSFEELHRHFRSHFTAGQCENCHKQLILIDGQCYVLQLHNQSNCNQNCPRNTSADNFCEIKTEIEEIEADIFENDTLNGSSPEYEQKSSDDEEQHDETEYVEIQPFEMIECGEIKIENENTLDLVENECMHCGKCFKAHDTLRDHVNKYHLPKNKKISLTDEECKQYPPERIATRATGERFLKKFHCTICNRYFMDRANLTKHLKNHEDRAKNILTRDEMVKLPSNQISVSSTGEMYARRYKCSICNRYFLSKKYLSSHMRYHKLSLSAKKLTDEDLKDLPADRISTLKTGEKVLREHKCELCEKYLLTKDTLKVHMNYVHGFKKKKIDKPRLLTEEESKQYPANQLSITSNGEIFLRKYQCDICKNYVLNRHVLVAHMRDIHCQRPRRRPIGNHTCDTCGKVFKWKSLLNDHKWAHSTTHRFICSYCAKGFKNKFKFEEHTNVHMGLRPFKCDHCDKTFCKKALLNVHQRVHTGYKPFKCNQEGCDRTYAHGSDLNRHLYGAHRIYKRKYECQICPRIFHEKKLLTKHMLAHD